MRSPILINVPHSSTVIPPEELLYFVTPNLDRELAVMTDHYCDDLFNTGAKMMRFPISRLVCDPERFRNDEDEAMSSVGMGAIYTACSDGTILKRVTPEHKAELMASYYDRYHQEFESTVANILREHNKCLIIDGHSFYDEPLPYEPDQSPDRPDICIGTDDYHTPSIIENVMYNHFKTCGYKVGINRPYSGSIVPLRYYRKDKRVMSVMIELNRGLYIDHSITKTTGYEKLKYDIAIAINLATEQLANCPPVYSDGQ